MNLDIRLPIGLLFGILGAILVVFGAVAEKTVDPNIYARSLGINVNLWWGLAMLVFGALMFLGGWRGTSAVKPADRSPEGRKLEETERAREASDRPRGH